MRYTRKRLVEECFQWFPANKLADWFQEEVEKGRAMVIIDPAKQSFYITMKNKRTKGYYGLVGDWVSKDEFGHIQIISQSTFDLRFDKLED